MLGQTNLTIRTICHRAVTMDTPEGRSPETHAYYIWREKLNLCLTLYDSHTVRWLALWKNNNLAQIPHWDPGLLLMNDSPAIEMK